MLLLVSPCHPGPRWIARGSCSRALWLRPRRCEWAWVGAAPSPIRALHPGLAFPLSRFLTASFSPLPSFFAPGSTRCFGTPAAPGRGHPGPPGPRLVRGLWRHARQPLHRGRRRGQEGEDAPRAGASSVGAGDSDGRMELIYLFKLATIACRTLHTDWEWLQWQNATLILRGRPAPSLFSPPCACLLQKQLEVDKEAAASADVHLVRAVRSPTRRQSLQG